MMQDSGADNSASAKKALAKAQRVLQVVATKRSAIALRDLRETLEECLRTEASTAMKVLGYRIAAKTPTAMTSDVWAAVLDACVAELGGSQNASVLLVCVPVLEQIPSSLLLSFLVSTEKEPMNKLRAVLTHENVDVRCCAISTLSRVSLEVATSVSTGGLMAFPFESHEARICCQQDTWSMVIDVWKLLFQTLLLGDCHLHDAIGAAFAAMRTLFTRTAPMAPFFPLAKPHPRSQAAWNDVTSAMVKEAFPLTRSLVTAARALPMKHQASAALWIAMLLFMMMERSGARCPSISVPYLELDIDTPEADDAGLDDDESDGASTERVRIDELVREQLRTWLLPLLSKKASLSQGTSVCRALFILLSHPLQQLTRVQHSGMLVNHLISQLSFVKSSATKLEFAQMLSQAFVWLTSAGCATWFTRTVDALFLIERQADRSELLQTLMVSVVDRVHLHRDFELFESLCAVELTTSQHPSGPKIPHSTVVMEVFQAIAQAVTSCEEETPVEAKQSLLLSQLIALKLFKSALTPKLPSASEDPVEADNRRRMLRSYMALLTAHFLQSTVWSTSGFIESLEFFRKEVLKVWRQIPSLRARLQLLSIGMHLAQTYQLVPAQVMVDAVKFEVVATFAVATDQAGEDSPAGQPSATTTAAFDDGRLGSGATVCGAVVDLVTDAPQERWVGADALLAVAECLKHMVALHPPAAAQLVDIFQELRTYVSRNCPATQLCHHLLAQKHLAGGVDPSMGFFSQELMDPCSNFHLSGQKQLAVNAELVKEPVLVTGSADPLAIQLSYCQLSDAILDVVTLEIACYNLTSLALSDFELRVCPVGSTAKCIDVPSDLRVRVLAAGGSVSSTLLPFGVLKAEKRFQLCKFARASFRVQVAFSDADALQSEQQDQEQTAEDIPTRLAMSDPFVVHLDALLSAPRASSATASFFHSQWQSAQATVQTPVQSRADGGLPASLTALSMCQRVLQHQNPRVAVVSELLVDLPFYCHVALIAKTRWDDYITAAVTLLSSGDETAGISQPSGLSSTITQWTGVLELRSTTTNALELDKFPLDVIRIFTGRVLERATSPPSFTGMDKSVGTPSLGLAAVDPFVASKMDSTPLFASNLQPVEIRLPQGVSFEASDWSSLQPTPVAAAASAAMDPWQ